MKLAYTACCFGDRERAWMLEKSAAHFGIKLHLMGVGQPFHYDLIATKVTPLLELLPKLQDEGYTHVLYMDGMDSFFVRGEEDILREYKKQCTPQWLVSIDSCCWPYRDLWDTIPARFRHPNTGGYMGEISVIITLWNTLLRKYGDRVHDECGLVQMGLIDGQCTLILDRDRRIFRGEVYEWTPEDSGCILHFNGGYFDPKHGREDRMLPVWEKLGIK